MPSKKSLISIQVVCRSASGAFLICSLIILVQSCAQDKSRLFNSEIGKLERLAVRQKKAANMFMELSKKRKAEMGCSHIEECYISADKDFSNFMKMAFETKEAINCLRARRAEAKDFDESVETCEKNVFYDSNMN